jgi:hypothetical protein
MPRVRSLVTHVELDVALKAHDCQGNSQHRILRGSSRLKVRNERGWDHYCLSCAKVIIERDIAHLRGVVTQLDKGNTARTDALLEA